MNFEDELQRALARKPAPDGFADRVVSRIAAPRHRTSWTLRRIAAAIVITASLGGLTAHQIIEHRRIEEGERARRELMTALRIASAKMRVAQRAVVHD